MKLKMKSAVITAVLVPAAVTAIAALLVLAGCKNPAKGAEIKTVRLTLTGDLNVTVKTEFITVEKGTKWSAVKKEADKAVGFAQNSTLEVWKFTSSKGEAVTDNYAFTEDKVIYALSKKIKNPVKLTITGSPDLTVKIEFLTIEKGTKWAEVKTRAEAAIDIDETRIIEAWKFANANGEVIPEEYAFTEDKVIYALSKKIEELVKLTLTGSSDLTVKTEFLTVEKGTKWAEVKTRAEAAIDIDETLIIEAWKFANANGGVIPEDYAFMEDRVIYALSKKAEITLTLTGGDEVKIKMPKLTFNKGVKWSEIAVRINEAVKIAPVTALTHWKFDGADGEKVGANYIFTESKTLFAVTEKNIFKTDGKGKITGSIFKREYLPAHLVIPAKIGNETITHIGYEPFYQHYNYNPIPIERVTLPVTLIELYGSCFSNCENLKSVDFSECVYLNKIGNYTFYNTGLTQVELPVNLKEIGEQVFSSCGSLTSLTVDSANPYLCAEENILYSKDKTVLYCAVPAITVLNLPESLEEIRPYAFKSCKGLTGGLDFSRCPNLTSIGEDAFRFCTGLNGDLNFFGCRSLTLIGESAFNNCKGLTGGLDFSSCTKLEIIGDYAFGYCEGLTGGLNFSDCTSLIKIGKAAFKECSRLTGGLDFSSCVNLKVIGEKAFSQCKKLSGVLNISGCISLMEIEEEAFAYREYLTGGLDFSSCTNLKVIGERAFLNCRGLTGVKFSDCANLTTIGNEAFHKCKNLAGGLDFSGCVNLTEIGDSAFNIYEGLTGALNLSGCTNLKVIGEKAFYGCKLENANLSGCTSLTKISSVLFRECTELVSVIFPPNLTEIGNSAFYLCTALKEADLSSTNLKEIGYSGFAGCPNAVVTLPASVSDIDNIAFGNSGGEDALCKKVRIPATPAEAYQRIRRLVINSRYSGIIETY